MKLKRSLLVALSLLLLAVVVTAQADTWYVYTANGKSLNLRSPVNNAVIGNIPYGTKLETDDHYSTETAAFVTWGGKSGYVKWNFLVKDPPPSKNGKAPAATATPRPAGNAKPQTAEMLPTSGDGAITVQAFGAYIEYTGSKNTDKGKYSAISFDKSTKLNVTADLPAGKSIDYWVIDGVRYDFLPRVPTSFTLDNITDSVIVEAVAKSQSNETQLSPEIIQEIRTGETLIVNTIHARLCHIRANDTGAGGWLKTFNFTDDYTNRATKKIETGGQVTVRVKAQIPKDKKIAYWKFNDLHIDFNKTVSEMIVRTLYVSKTYEPVFGKVTKKTTTTTKEDPQYYTVTCINCTFSGGGYTNAKSGEVLAGTEITVTNRTGSTEVASWRVNGSEVTRAIQQIVDGKKTPVRIPVTANSIRRTINKNTKIECYGVIN